MADDIPDDSAVLSDVDDDGDPSTPSHIPSVDLAITTDHRVRDLLSQLDAERRARQESDDTLKRREESINRLRAFAQDVIKKRDDALRDKEESNARLAETIKQKDEISKQLADAIRDREEISKLKDSLRSEMEMAAQMMVTGIDKISAKVSSFKNFAASGGLPRSQKYATGLPAVAYGVIKRANEIVEEMLKQIDVVTKSRDQAREQIEQRNYEIAIEVSQLEASISGLRDEVSKNGVEIERLERLAGERGAKIGELESEVLELRQFGEERDGKLTTLEAKMDAQRTLIIDQLSNVSKVNEQIHEIIRIAHGAMVDQSCDSLFVWEEMDMDQNLQTLLEGTVSVYDKAKDAVEKVRGNMEDKNREINRLKEKDEKKKENVTEEEESDFGVKLVEIEEKNPGAIAIRRVFDKYQSKGKRKELSPQDAAVIIQMTFRAHLVRRSKVLRCLRDLAVAKAKLKEIRSLFYNFSYGRRIANDAEERQRFSEKIIVLLLTVDAIEGPDYMVRAARRSMVEELEYMLEEVDPHPHEKLGSLRRRKFDMPATGRPNGD